MRKVLHPQPSQVFFTSIVQLVKKLPASLQAACDCHDGSQMCLRVLGPLLAAFLQWGLGDSCQRHSITHSYHFRVDALQSCSGQVFTVVVTALLGKDLMSESHLFHRSLLFQTALTIPCTAIPFPFL